MQGLIEIKSDVFDIASRLESIDPRYTLCYNVALDRYEVYSREPVFTLQVVLSEKPPDARSLMHVRRTRAERARELLEELEREEERRLKRLAGETAEKAAEAYYDLLEAESDNKRNN